MKPLKRKKYDKLIDPMQSELVAMADLFPERTEKAKQQINDEIAKDPSLKSKFI